MPEDEEPLEHHRPPIILKVSEVFYIILFIIGVAIYFWYSFRYNAWLDIGIVVVTMPFIAFGIVGMILTHLNRQAREEHQKV